MVQNLIQYITPQKKIDLIHELEELRKKKIPNIAKRIDEAKQLGDLSENAEYHQAKDDMAWTQSRLKEVDFIINNAEIIDESAGNGDIVILGSTITIVTNGKERTYTIVGAQEADPASGRISNESPLGEAFLGKKLGQIIDVDTPGGKQTHKIQKIS